MARTARASALHLPSDMGREPEAIAAAVVEEIAAGRLDRGDPLPSTRALAAQTGVPRSAVVSAYDVLLAAGIIETTPGSGATVVVDQGVARSATGVGAAPRRPRERLRPNVVRPERDVPHRVRFNLMPGAPDVSLIREREWRQAWRSATASVPELDWYHPMSHPALQGALVAHLRQMRGIATEAHDVVIFPGVSAAVHAVTHALRPRSAAMEDPGYPMARIPLQHNVARVDLILVDDHGMQVERLDRQELVYVTPAHQFPLGGRMPVTRREQLLRWASATGAVIIEDDFDGEYRHDSAPLGPLRSMASGQESVVYIGTASKVLTPHLRLAWAVVPPWMSEAVRVAGTTLRTDASLIASDALAHLIGNGGLSRHLARAQRTYAARRRRLVAALAQHLPEVELVGVEAGIHVAVRWRDDTVRDSDVAAECAARGIALAPLSAYAAQHLANGLLLGYAQLPETQADAVVAEIAEALEVVRQGRRTPVSP
ncbi:MocR-like pyridoxine biosynthesis transcription factor PdxR [Luteipulveratus halotolerans]|uniref:HTH gntR-type domain-containing protein n=1 Tax=Luteipulveratus halotolerans TaxID=1631356 RepID=A0A0L6CFV6_9MICO|nr:PLP-dependent aminotransferase family protein [Luteipulveratus halotolerans]KNX36711.1 hypothetical protein VV01_05390 [Luteipulveratus halotolerans]